MSSEISLKPLYLTVVFSLSDEVDANDLDEEPFDYCADIEHLGVLGWGTTGFLSGAGAFSNSNLVQSDLIGTISLKPY